MCWCEDEGCCVVIEVRWTEAEQWRDLLGIGLD